MATYVMSDIHGRYKEYLAMLKQIDFDNFQSNDRIYILGDVIDRGPGGVAILRHIMRNREKIQFIIGNHELMMVEAIKTNDYMLWISNGGQPTYDTMLTLSQNEQDNIIRFIEAARYQSDIDIGGRRFILAHGRPYEATINGEQCSVGPFDRYYISHMNKAEQIVWGKMHESYQIPGKTIVFGHYSTHHYQDTTPWSIYHGKNCIGIDCGCAYNNKNSRLGCIRLDDMREYYETIRR